MLFRSATQSYQLGNMADVPLSVRQDLFVENLFEPFGTAALAMLQNRVAGEQRVSVADQYGTQRVQKRISLAEIRTGTYRVVATLNKQDQTKIARLQSMERLFPLLTNPEARAAYLQSNKRFNIVNFVNDSLELAGMNSSRYFDDIPPEQAQQEIMQLQGPPQLPPGQGPPGGPSPNPTGNNNPQPRQLGINGTPTGGDQSDKSLMGQLMQYVAAQRAGGGRQ